MKLRHVVILLLLIGALSAGAFGLGRLLVHKDKPGPYAEALVIRMPVSRPEAQSPASPEPESEPDTPVTLPKVVSQAPAAGALLRPPRQDDLVRDLAGVLAVSYEPADPCEPSDKAGVLRLSTRELVRRYEPSLAESPETSLRLSVTPPMLELGFMFVSGRFAEEVRTQTRTVTCLCPADGHSRRLSRHEVEEARVLIAAWFRDLAACARESRSSRDCDYARRLASNLLQGERTRDRVITTAGRLLDSLAHKIDQGIEKTGG